MTRLLPTSLSFVFWILLVLAVPLPAAEPGLVGYWKLQGDSRDHSASGLHGTSHDVDLATSSFNGKTSYVEVPSALSLHLGTSDFTIAAWVNTERDLTDVPGDLITKFDHGQRKGFNL